MYKQFKELKVGQSVFSRSGGCIFENNIVKALHSKGYSYIAISNTDGREEMFDCFDFQSNTKNLYTTIEQIIDEAKALVIVGENKIGGTHA